MGQETRRFNAQENAGHPAAASRPERMFGADCFASRVAYREADHEPGDAARPAHAPGLNQPKLAAVRLYAMALARGVQADHLFEGPDGGPAAELGSAPLRRGLIELARHLAAIPDERRPEALRAVARTLAGEAGAA